MMEVTIGDGDCKSRRAGCLYPECFLELLQRSVYNMGDNATGMSRLPLDRPGVERWLSWSKALAWKASRWGKTSSRGFESHSLRHFYDLAVLDGEVAVPCTRNPL